MAPFSAAQPRVYPSSCCRHHRRPSHRCRCRCSVVFRRCSFIRCCVRVLVGRNNSADSVVCLCRVLLLLLLCAVCYVCVLCMCVCVLVLCMLCVVCVLVLCLLCYVCCAVYAVLCVSCVCLCLCPCCVCCAVCACVLRAVCEWCVCVCVSGVCDDDDDDTGDDSQQWAARATHNREQHCAYIKTARLLGYWQRAWLLDCAVAAVRQAWPDGWPIHRLHRSLVCVWCG